MKGHTYPDQLEVINGPEDGTQFPITRSPLNLGGDPACPIFLRLDPALRRFHARVTVVSEGYRIRALGPGELFVNGKRAGLLRSRVLRNGGMLQAGATQLCLQTAPDGLAHRSWGLPFENDLAWLLRLSGRKLRLIGRLLFRIVWSLPRKVLRHWFALAMLTGAFAFLHPPFRYALLRFFNRAVYFLQNLLDTITNG